MVHFGPKTPTIYVWWWIWARGKCWIARQIRRWLNKQKLTSSPSVHVTFFLIRVSPSGYCFDGKEKHHVMGQKRVNSTQLNSPIWSRSAEAKIEWTASNKNSLEMMWWNYKIKQSYVIDLVQHWYCMTTPTR